MIRIFETDDKWRTFKISTRHRTFSSDSGHWRILYVQAFRIRSALKKVLWITDMHLTRRQTPAKNNADWRQVCGFLVDNVYFIRNIW